MKTRLFQTVFIVKPTISWTLSFGALTMHPTFLTFSRDQEGALTECKRRNELRDYEQNVRGAMNCATTNRM